MISDIHKTVYIVSLKYAPGLFKEFKLLGGNIKKKGIRVIYLIDAGYRWLDDSNDETIYLSGGEDKGKVLSSFMKNILKNPFSSLFDKHEPSFICFYNSHPSNILLAKYIKGHFPKTHIAVYLHDPCKPSKKEYGFVKGLYIRLVEIIQKLTVRYVDYVISPSEYSSQLFKKLCPRFMGKNYIAPLLVPDTKEVDLNKPKMFSIVGSAHKATGHDTFLDLVNYVAVKALPYRFVLISSSNLTEYISKLMPQTSNFLEIINKKDITDSEIDEVIRKSYAVFRLDKEVTQSGVLPLSFMHGVPVIARNIIGLRQHVEHQHNGYLVPFNCYPEELIVAMEFIINNFSELSGFARQSYQKIWAEKNWDNYYLWLIKILNDNKLDPPHH